MLTVVETVGLTFSSCLLTKTGSNVTIMWNFLSKKKQKIETL